MNNLLILYNIWKYRGDKSNDSIAVDKLSFSGKAAKLNFHPHFNAARCFSQATKNFQSDSKSIKLNWRY